MAPYIPEEVDLFSAPHTRMKELVDEYFEMLQCTNFASDNDVDALLTTLYKTFAEFKSHEQIENKIIMKKLKHKLKRLSIKNTALCNCHKDNKLTDMMILLHDGYTKKTIQDRLNYGLQLKKALRDFTDDFLPHMKEEEEEFQPLLMKYFSYDELKKMKEKVMKRHFTEKHTEAFSYHDYCWLIRRVVDSSGSDTNSSDTDSYCDGETSGRRLSAARQALTVESLCSEQLLRILSYLSPRDLVRCSGVNSTWRLLARDPSLWQHLAPVKWAQGEWTRGPPSVPAADSSTDADDDLLQSMGVFDADADIDETDVHRPSACQARREVRLWSGLVKHLLPVVGHGVKTLDAAFSRVLTNNTLSKVLELCPNIIHLDTRYAKLTDKAFRSLAVNGCGSRLQYVDFSGVSMVTSMTLVRLGLALADCRLASAGTCVCDAYRDITGTPLDMCSSAPGPPHNSSPRCHDYCQRHVALDMQLESCSLLPRVAPLAPQWRPRISGLKYLSLSGCADVTDSGLRALTALVSLPQLRCLDCSGCMQLTGRTLRLLVAAAPALAPEHLYYCDNLEDGPHPDTASACRNSTCNARVCCRSDQ